MCGILIVLAPNGEADRRRSRAALDAMAHRGPDGEGLEGLDGDGSVVAPDAPARLLLGHRRLAILDPTSTGAQPMVCVETGNRIIFNGEIYNFLELRAELAALGERFSGGSDTEVVLAAWRRWGVEAFPRFNGMWALAVYDRMSGDVVVSRDRLGVKPLYFARHAGQIAFASEIRGVLRALHLPPRVNSGAVFDFLAGGLTDHDDETFYAGVERVPAGALWRLKPDGVLVKGRFHHWPAPDERMESDGRALTALVADAVRLRLRSDAPTVSLMSGGLDSLLITGLAVAERGPRTCFVGAFTYGYRAADAARFDETARAAGLLALIAPGLPHIVHQVETIPEGAALRRVAAAQEEPFTTPSLVAHERTYAALRAGGMTVALNGEGADELFGGYIRQYLSRMVRDAVLGGRAEAAWRLVRSPHVDLRQVANRLMWDLPQAVLEPLLRRFRPQFAALDPDFRRRHADRFDRIRLFQRQSTEERLRSDVLSTNLPQILRYADRNSMWNGVEARSPFLDYRVVEHALRLPLSAKLGADGGKLALRAAFAGRFPAELLAPQKVLGFGHAEQFSALGAVGPLPPEAGEFIDVDRFSRILARAAATGLPLHPTAWLPLSLGLWLNGLTGG